MARPGGSRAVETFLRNFEGEKQRYQQILEVTLCYGVFCLAQNFSLKGITFEELKAVTRYDAVRKRDYYVSKGGARTGRKLPPSPATVEKPESEGRFLRAKPSHAWRDGASKAVDDEFASHLPTSGLGEPGSSNSETAASPALPASVASLLEPAREAPTSMDDVDFHSRLLGKLFVDTAWAVFTGRTGSQIMTRDALDELYVRVDQRKKPSSFPATELPVASFGEFLNAYVATCVSQFQHKSAVTLEEDSEEDLAVEYGDRDVSRRKLTRSVPVAAEAVNSNQPRRRVVDTGTSAEVAARRLASAKPARKPLREQPRALPTSLQCVRSKIQPELGARRDKVLRVKKTQTQLMKESLARARLAEYEARKHLQDARDRSMLKKKAPLDDIPQGAAALEIVDNFVRSPLMDTFGKDGVNASVNVTQAIGKRSDPIQEELYGAAPLDDSFVGCKVPKQRRPTDRPKRGYNGWLGDFGPVHTKTVRHEWSDNDDSEDELGRQRPASTFEWNFDNFTKESNERRGLSPAVNAARGRHSGVLNRSNSSDVGYGEGDESLNDNLSDGSNSVYQWLKEAV